MKLKSIIIGIIMLISGGVGMAEDDITATGLNIAPESLSFSQAKPYPMLMIHEDLDEAKIKEIQDTYSHDKETARIMVGFYRDGHFMTRHLSLIEDLINLNREVARKLMIKYKISFTDKEGNKIGYED